jgi:hypothetical protein
MITMGFTLRLSLDYRNTATDRATMVYELNGNRIIRFAVCS